jgi:hypothetical protein
VGYLPESNVVSTAAEESPLFRAVAKQQLPKTLQAEEDIVFTDL